MRGILTVLARRDPQDSPYRGECKNLLHRNVRALSSGSAVYILLNLMSSTGWKQNAPTVLHEDNLGALELAYSHRYHRHTEDTQMKYHHVIHSVKDNEVSVVHVASDG